MGGEEGEGKKKLEIEVIEGSEEKSKLRKKHLRPHQTQTTQRGTTRDYHLNETHPPSNWAAHAGF